MWVLILLSRGLSRNGLRGWWSEGVQTEVVPFPRGPCLAVSNPSGTCGWPQAPRHRQLVPSELRTLQRQQPREALAPTVSTRGPAGQRPTCCLWGWRRWHVQSHGKGGLGSRAFQSRCHWMGPGCQGREHPARPELVSGLSGAWPALPAGGALGGAGSKEPPRAPGTWLALLLRAVGEKLPDHVNLPRLC